MVFSAFRRLSHRSRRLRCALLHTGRCTTSGVNCGGNGHSGALALVCSIARSRCAGAATHHVVKDGASAEIAVVGNEGLVGIALFMGGETTPSRAVVQSAGEAFRLSSKR